MLARTLYVSDLGLVKGKALVLKAIKDLWAILLKWPGIVIIPCDALDTSHTKKAQRKVNWESYKALEGGLGHHLLVPHVWVDSANLYM